MMPSRSWIWNRIVYAILDALRSTAGQPLSPGRSVDHALVRPATAADLPAIHAVYRASLRGEPQERNFARLARRFPHLCCVAVAEGRCVGYALGRVDKGLLTGQHAAFLFSIGVLTSEQGRGLGRVLVEFFREGARSLGLRELNLEVETENEAARSLYASLGLTILQAPRTGNPATAYMAARL